MVPVLNCFPHSKEVFFILSIDEFNTTNNYFLTQGNLKANDLHVALFSDTCNMCIVHVVIKQQSGTVKKNKYLSNRFVRNETCNFENKFQICIAKLCLFRFSLKHSTCSCMYLKCLTSDLIFSLNLSLRFCHFSVSLLMNSKAIGHILFLVALFHCTFANMHLTTCLKEDLS